MKTTYSKNFFPLKNSILETAPVIFLSVFYGYGLIAGAQLGAWEAICPQLELSINFRVNCHQGGTTGKMKKIPGYPTFVGKLIA